MHPFLLKTYSCGSPLTKDWFAPSVLAVSKKLIQLGCVQLALSTLKVGLSVPTAKLGKTCTLTSQVGT